MGKGEMKLTRRIFTMCIVQFAVMLCVWQALAAGYQTYRGVECWWCHTTKVRLVVHHIESQSARPDLANDHPENYVTLCDPYLFRSQGCHFFWHKRNWTNNVVELKTLVNMKE
jgi:hypothetical protein